MTARLEADSVPASSWRVAPKPTDQPYDAKIILDTSTLTPGIQLLPDDIKADVGQLYRALRTIDNMVDDERPGAKERVDAMECWAHGEEPNTPEATILADLIKRHPFPASAVLKFCEGMRHDLAHATVETEADLEQYCQRVGGAVGEMLAGIFDTPDIEAKHKMAILGRATQRVNILRDIDEDYAHGRLYIARATIERYGFPAPGEREDLLRDQITRAEQLYAQGIGVIGHFPRARRAIAVTVALYRETLRQIEREGYGRRPSRVVIPEWRKRMVIYQYGGGRSAR